MEALVARKVPTTDPLAIKEGLRRLDVILFDGNGSVKYRFPWYAQNIPTRRNKYVTVNCYKYSIVWG